MGRLINIDNGGTLTDVCVIDGETVYRTKTLTTPYDLSRCFIDGLTKVSSLIYGAPDLLSLLRSTDHIRYSTTQGTNALVEKKGPRLGILLSGNLSATDLQRDANEREFFGTLVGGRVRQVDVEGEPNLEVEVLRSINTLASAGANRIVVVHGGIDRSAAESRIKRILLAKFPAHLLGAIPILYSHEVAEDDDDVRRAWTTIFNAFLHPAMEKFLYNAEHKLRASKNQNPLLIFRNDGLSARVAKTTAIKTYSSGPRGGIEGVRVVAKHYGFPHLLSMDVGGTTTDIGEVKDDYVRIQQYGDIDGVATSFPLCDLVSVGVGGSSVIKADGSSIQVGPQSMGSTPGPACFALGGTQATITDAALLSGLLDPASFFGGGLELDRDRAAAALLENVAAPLQLTVDEVVEAMQKAWVDRIANALVAFTSISAETTLAAFGGAGPLFACQVADAVGIDRVLIPGLAPVFSAYGLGFSDIGHRYETRLDGTGPDVVRQAVADLLDQAKRDMFGEGFDLSECDVAGTVRITYDGREDVVALDDVDGLLHGHVDARDHLPTELPATAQLRVALAVSKAIPRPVLSGRFQTSAKAKSSAAITNGTRTVLREGEFQALPVYQIEKQPSGASAAGPAVLEDAYFTGRIDPGWRFEINDGGDILLSRA
ncbi:hydantoinase/oxoprolinase [Candidatus Protofrankia californiensis]|uniref:Hydantoinase/oxoprolinase n=1 Tax=Candidatus Protofrankia californiensis TaxID=1839754 RepID=A0A1C3NZI7_9ACTN|nr:hydantoinase/oxoprolinase [Candidatus Protofrankia californiensis]